MFMTWEDMEWHENNCPKDKMKVFYEDWVIKLSDCYNCETTSIEVKENRLTKVLGSLGLENLLHKYLLWKTSKVYERYGFEKIEWEKVEKPIK